MNPLLLDHLWQSTIVLAGIGLLTPFLRHNGAHIRHTLWLAASVKFLLPFALLNMVGHDLSLLLAAPPVQPPVVRATFAVSQPFSDGPVFMAMPAPGLYLLPGTVIWLAGVLAVAGVWLSRWHKLRATMRTARASDIVAPMPVMILEGLLEPGLVGIFRPVLLLPSGINEKLSPMELQSIVAHETAHMRRHDNLTAALHMLVEALFWFWPPVWWLGSRLVAERERACDESVVAAGNDPQTYAEGILKVCKFYLHPPLACTAGVSGADLKQRMEDIMKNNIIAHLDLPRKALLLACAAALLALPLASGIFTTPSALAQTDSSSPGTEAAPLHGPVVQRSDKGPSPGLEAAIRRELEGDLAGDPAFEIMSPALQDATKQKWWDISSDAKNLGPVQAITFQKINRQGWDVYEVKFAHGSANVSAPPLVHGKFVGLGHYNIQIFKSP